MKKILLPALIFLLCAFDALGQISINRSGVSVQDAVTLLNKVSNYSVTINPEGIDLGRKVDISADNAKVRDVLDQIFAGQDVEYRIEGRVIYVSRTLPRNGVQVAKRIFQGRVTDSAGEPLPGAALKVGGKGFITDIDGNFELSGVGFPADVVVSFIGYSDQTVHIRGNESMPYTIVMSDSNYVLDDVVIVGYGTQNRRTLTTSISKVDGESIYNAPVASVGDALKGKVPGLRVATNNALPGEAPRMLIRGGSSINLGNDPVVIVDGITRDMNDINPNDIESIEVLKDAASAGIYGARASNGIILITTKKGNASKGPQVTFESQVGIQQPSRLWDMMSAREYLAFLRPVLYDTFNATSTPNLTYASFLTGAYSAGTGNTESSIYTTKIATGPEDILDGWEWMYDPLDETRVLTFTSTDYQRQWFRNALWHKEYVGVNGGAKDIRYMASMSYLDDEGIVAMSRNRAYTAHANTIFKITDRIEASTTFDYSHVVKNPLTANYYNAIGRGITLAPTHRDYDSEGRWLTGGTHVAQQIPSFYEAFYDRETATDRTSFNMNLKWKIIDGLQAVAQYAVFNNDYRGSYYAYGERNNTTNYYGGTSRSTTETRTQTYRNNVQGYLSFKKKFGRHGIDATAGSDYTYWRYWYLTANSTGSESDKVPLLQSGLYFTASNQDYEQALLSFFGRASYDYDGRYILAAVMRADASSKFAPENRWGYFPSASFAWLLSEEPFWNVSDRVVNLFKFRASYGLTGNNSIGVADTYGTFSTANIYAGQSVTIPSAMINRDLKWETTAQLDLGFDASFFRDRIRLLADYYNKVTSNMIYSVSLPDTGTFGSAKANVGSARFYGFEFELHTVNIQKRDFVWSTDLTYAFNRNKVLSLPDEYKYTDLDGKDAWRIGGYTMTESGERFGGTAVGEPLGRIYGYKIDHIIQTGAEADAAYYDNLSAGYRRSDGKSILGRKDIGDYEWKNRPGSALMSDGSEQINAEDMFYLGNVMPHSTGGINNTVTFKRLTFSVYMDYALGHSIYNYMKSRVFQNNFGNCNANLDKMVYDCWKYPGDKNAKYARFFPNDPDFGNRNFSRSSDFNVEKADYLCIRDVSLMYDLPEKWVERLHMKKLTVGVTGNTLYYFTGVSGSICPETGMGTGSSDSFYSSVSTGSSENSSIAPTARKILFNVRITF